MLRNGPEDTQWTTEFLAQWCMSQVCFVTNMIILLTITLVFNRLGLSVINFHSFNKYIVIFNLRFLLLQSVQGF